MPFRLKPSFLEPAGSSRYPEGMKRTFFLLIALLPAVVSVAPLSAAASTPAVSAARGKKKARHSLSFWVMRRAFAVGRKINGTGGYRFDGHNDCYGFLRRVWSPVLRFYKGQRRSSVARLPVSDIGSGAWKRITNWNELRPGDLLATAKGHKWGADWHAGLYYGKVRGVHKIYDNSGRSSMGGAYVRAHPPGMFKYYYAPVHKLLVKYNKIN